MEIETERFVLRPLTVDDASDRYLCWLQDTSAQRFIVASSRTKDVADLRKYVAEREARDDVLFLGIFIRETMDHIGNIKFEPLNRASGFAVMGILIGEPAYRGKGVAGEVLNSCAKWLRENCNIEQILLGVERENRPAISAYEKVGFVVEETPHLSEVAPGCCTMVWRI